MTLKESYEATQQIEKSKNSKALKARALRQYIHDTHAEELRTLRESREENLNKKANYKAKVYNEMVATALKAIYISSLQECTIMSKTDYTVANRLIDNYVDEHGGQELLFTMGQKNSQFLTELKSLIEDAAEETMDNTDETDVDTNVAPTEEPKEKMLNNMEEDDDVDSAVDIISKRISNAEEEFIKKNAEDKEKIKNLVDDINSRISAVKSDVATSDEDKEAIAQESAREYGRMVNDIYEKRKHTIFEDMVAKSTEKIMKDQHLKSLYTTEDGNINMDKIVSSVKCMYGFLECVNTIKLESVTAEYVQQLIDEI